MKHETARATFEVVAKFQQWRLESDEWLAVHGSLAKTPQYIENLWDEYFDGFMTLDPTGRAVARMMIEGLRELLNID